MLEGFWGFEILPKSRQRDTQDMCEVFYAVKFQIRVYIFNILFAWSICSDKMIELYTVSYIASMGYFYTCIDLSLEITIEQIGIECNRYAVGDCFLRYYCTAEAVFNVDSWYARVL